MFQASTREQNNVMGAAGGKNHMTLSWSKRDVFAGAFRLPSARWVCDAPPDLTD